jgi:hypothetical protein
MDLTLHSNEDDAERVHTEAADSTSTSPSGQGIGTLLSNFPFRASIDRNRKTCGFRLMDEAAWIWSPSR